MTIQKIKQVGNTTGESKQNYFYLFRKEGIHEGTDITSYDGAS